MSVHCGAHCSVHCACAGRALRKTRSLCNSASGGVEAHATLVHRAVHFLPTCGGQSCNVTSLFVASSLEDESEIGLGFWHLQKGICSSLRLHIHKPKNLLVASLFAASSLEGESVWIEVTGVRGRFFGLWMCKHKLGQIPFCTCKDPNPNTLSSSKLLAPSKEATLHHLLRMWAKTGNQKLCVLHGALM